MRGEIKGKWAGLPKVTKNSAPLPGALVEHAEQGQRGQSSAGGRAKLKRQAADFPDEEPQAGKSNKVDDDHGSDATEMPKGRDSLGYDSEVAKRPANADREQVTG